MMTRYSAGRAAQKTDERPTCNPRNDLTKPMHMLHFLTRTRTAVNSQHTIYENPNAHGFTLPNNTSKEQTPFPLLTVESKTTLKNG